MLDQQCPGVSQGITTVDGENNSRLNRHSPYQYCILLLKGSEREVNITLDGIKPQVNWIIRSSHIFGSLIKNFNLPGREH